MRKNLFNIKQYYDRLRKENLIIEEGYHLNRKDNSIDTDYTVNGILITLKKFINDRTEIVCWCKYHSLRNATEDGRNSICRTKNVLTLHLINQCSKSESY